MDEIKQLAEIILNAHPPTCTVFETDNWDPYLVESKKSFELAEAAIKELSLRDDRNDIIPLLTTGKGEINLICKALVVIDSKESFSALFELFYDNRDEGYIAEAIFNHSADIFNEVESTSLIEEIAVRAYEFGRNSEYADIFAKLQTEKAIECLLNMIYQTHQEQEYRNRAINALSKIGCTVNSFILERLETKWIPSEKAIQDQYRKDLLKVLEITGDAQVCTDIGSLLDDSDIRKDVERTQEKIAARGNIEVKRIYSGVSLDDIRKKARESLPGKARIIREAADESGLRYIDVQAPGKEYAVIEAMPELKEGEWIEGSHIKLKGGFMGISFRRWKDYQVPIASPARYEIVFSMK